MNQEKTEHKSGSKKGIFIFFVVLLLGINLVSLFFNYKQNEDIKEKQVTLDSNAVQIKQLDEQLKAKIAELTAARDEIEKLGGDKTALEEQIAILQNEKAKLAKDAGYYRSQYNKIKGEIDNAMRIKDEANKEIESLKLQLAQKDTVINEKNTVINQKEQAISSLTQEKTQLSEKVAIASILKADHITALAITAKGKEKPSATAEFKAKYIDQLKIGFTIAENKVAEKNTKELYIRVVEPDGATIYNTSTGGGEMTYNGKSIFYSVKYDLSFNGNASPVLISYKKDGEWKVGKHTIEIYCEGKLIGTGSFTVLK
jgi:hypothetical protein